MSLRGLLILLAGLLCAACASGDPSGRVERGTTKQLQSASLEDYKLGPGDRLRIVIYDEPTLSNEYVVSPKGRIAFPLIGDIQAEGLNITDFSRALETALKQGFLKNPQASAEVLMYRPFYILGQVQRPGTYPFAAGMTVMSAAATAGGFTYRAETHRVYIKHVGQDTEVAYDLTSQTPVQPGDTVRIGERLF
jgi:polysaccharide export outer membrane protein